MVTHVEDTLGGAITSRDQAAPEAKRFELLFPEAEAVAGEKPLQLGKRSGAVGIAGRIYVDQSGDPRPGAA